MTTIRSLDTQYVPIMFDCETLGTTPNTTPVLQLALVSFDPKTFEAKDEFEIFLPLNEQIRKGRKPNPSTVEWWEKPERRDVLNYILQGVNAAKPMNEALLETYQWCMKQVNGVKSKGQVKTQFWAKPVGFDYPFLDGLYQEYQVPSPFHYREVMDMKTYVMSMFEHVFYALYKYPLPLGANTEMYWLFNDYAKIRDKGKEDEAHNATVDCHYQLEWIRWAKEHCDRILSHYDSTQQVKSYLETL